MEILTATDVRDFRVRGNYFSWRSLLARRDQHSSKKQSQFRINLDILLRSWTTNCKMAQPAASSSANPTSPCSMRRHREGEKESFSDSGRPPGRPQSCG